MYLRDATMDDLPDIVAIYNSTVPSRMVTADTVPVPVESRIPWFHAHDPANRPLWIAESEDKKIMGWISLQSFYGRPAYDSAVEVSIYIAEEFRGLNLGRRMLEAIITAAPQLGIKTLLGFIFGHNIPSRRLFESCGFACWGHLPGIAVLDEIERDLDIFGLRVGKTED